MMNPGRTSSEKKEQPSGKDNIMKLLVNEVAKLTGVTVRTLHYYDEIGLLRPSEISESGYRYYDEDALALLQQIMFYRELEFPLKDIREIILPDKFDRNNALRNQKDLLYAKRKRINGLIELIDEILDGDNKTAVTDFTAFDEKEIERMKNEYRKEVVERWGETDEFRQSEQKARTKTKDDWRFAQEEAESIFSGFAALMDKSPSDAEVTALVRKWQDHINRNYYTCSDEMLLKLGEMYITDARFKNNLDSHGTGTAQYMHDAIVSCCS